MARGGVESFPVLPSLSRRFVCQAKQNQVTSDQANNIIKCNSAPSKQIWRQSKQQPNRCFDGGVVEVEVDEVQSSSRSVPHTTHLTQNAQSQGAREILNLRDDGNIVFSCWARR